MRARLAPYAAVIDTFLPHLDAFALTQKLNEAFPSVLEFCMLPSIRPIVEELITSGVDTLNVDHLNVLIPGICLNWRRNICTSLVGLLPPWLRHSEDGDDSSADLESALVWFYCRSKSGHLDPCYETTIAYPRILSHSHIYALQSERFEPQNPDDDLVNAVYYHRLLKRSVFDPELLQKEISFDLHASFVACEIVTLCGLDPETALSSDMDSMDNRIACVPCRTVMTWRKAVRHFPTLLPRSLRC